MQQWEYMVIILKTFRGGFKIHTVNGAVPQEWDWEEPGLPLHILLNNFGGAGWELVDRAVIPGELVFKRALASSTESHTTRLPNYPGL